MCAHWPASCSSRTATSSDVHISYVAPGGVVTPIYEQAGNYAGWAGRPPPPAVSPERVAKVIRDRLDNPSPRTQVGPANDFMRLGFSALPGLYDVLVGPLMKLAAFDATRPLVEHAGNVLALAAGAQPAAR